MQIIKSDFGTTKSGEAVIKYSLINDKKFIINILNYGGTITEILAPDKNGVVENIVLNFHNIKDYEEYSPYFGCITGRTAGRISNGSFKIDDVTYSLAKNNGNNNLHGGVKGFDKVIWTVEEKVQNDTVSITLSHLSKHMEEGYPGNLKVEVEYILNNKNELTIKYYGVSDKKTLINLTNHTYFNLNGNAKANIHNHKLTLDADKFLPVTTEVMPTSEVVEVEGTVFDFRNGKKIAEDIKKEDIQLLNAGGYDHPFVLAHSKEICIRLEEETSGRAMEMITDQPIVVFYSGNFLKDEPAVCGNVNVERNLAMCLETQDYPDAINNKNFPCKIYEAGEEYKAVTTYRFLV